MSLWYEPKIFLYIALTNKQKKVEMWTVQRGQQLPT